MSPEERKEREAENMRLDEHADLHSRMSTLESGQVSLSRRITRLEDSRLGSHVDDPLGGILSPGLIWAMVILTVAPLIIEAVKTWKSSSSSAS